MYNKLAAHAICCLNRTHVMSLLWLALPRLVNVLQCWTKECQIMSILFDNMVISMSKDTSKKKTFSVCKNVQHLKCYNNLTKWSHSALVDIFEKSTCFKGLITPLNIH